METIVNQRKTYLVEDVVDISEDDDASQGVDLGGRPILGLLVPALNDTPTIVAEATIDEAANWYDVHEADGTTEAVQITGAATPFFVGSDELSQLAAYCGGEHSFTQIRLALSAAQTADRTFVWVCCG